MMATVPVCGSTIPGDDDLVRRWSNAITMYDELTIPGDNDGGAMNDQAVR